MEWGKLRYHMVAQFSIQHYWVNLVCENEFHVISERVLCKKICVKVGL